MLRFLFNGQRAVLWYGLLVLFLPLLTLIVFGLFHLWQNRWLIPVAVSWLLVTLIGYAIYRWWPEHRNAQPVSELTQGEDGLDTDNSLLKDLPIRLDERTDWTRVDREVWHVSVLSVEAALAHKPMWNELPEVALELLTGVSEHYGAVSTGTALDANNSNSSKRNRTNTTYRFTLPEMLLVVSVTSSRYRQLLLSHVPFAEKIKISALLRVYARQDQIVTGAGWLNTARRTTRLVNPLAALAGELRDQFTDRLFTSLSENVQNDLKRLLLQELVQVGMDLYSGRLKSTDEERSLYQSGAQMSDRLAMAEAIEPLRVVLVGQVSAGKSSLINALLNELEAETDILPTTDKTTVHALRLAEASRAGPEVSGTSQDAHVAGKDDMPRLADVHLIDTVGLVDDSAPIDATLQLAKQADLLIWVTRATQPARSPEAKLQQALAALYAANPSLRPPPTLLIVSHVDLLSPKAEWQPPYDLGGHTQKAQNIQSAIKSCIAQIGLPELTPAIPISLALQHDPYNVDVLISQILLLRTEAVQVQLNRRRLERDTTMGGWRDRWDQASQLGKVTGKLLTRSVLGD